MRNDTFPTFDNFVLFDHFEVRLDFKREPIIAFRCSVFGDFGIWSVLLF